MQLNKLTALAAVSCAISLLTGCQSYKNQNLKASTEWKMGATKMALAEYSKTADKNATSKDAIIWRLEHATALRADHQFKESNDAFSKVEDLFVKQEKKGNVRVGQELAANQVNLAQMDYEGRAYDKIMVNTFKALNYLNLGQTEEARVELQRAYQRQQDAVEENKKKIEKAQEEAKAELEKKSKNANGKAKVDEAGINKMKASPMFQKEMDKHYGDLNTVKSYGDYVNPFTVFMDGLYFLYNGSGGSDAERAGKSLERVLSFSGENKYLKQDLENAKAAQELRLKVEPTTYVIFETGRAPMRDEIKVWLPTALIPGSPVPSVSAAFPKLKPLGEHVPQLNVNANGGTETTVSLCSMDNVIGTDFKNELPIIITRQVASTVAKAIVDTAIVKGAEQADAMYGLAAKIILAGTRLAQNIADTRTWTTLPKEFQYCRIATPADRTIEIVTPNGISKQQVKLGDGTVNVVYVKCNSNLAPLNISQFKLK